MLQLSCKSASGDAMSCWSTAKQRSGRSRRRPRPAERGFCWASQEVRRAPGAPALQPERSPGHGPHRSEAWAKEGSRAAMWPHHLYDSIWLCMCRGGRPIIFCQTLPTPSGPSRSSKQTRRSWEVERSTPGRSLSPGMWRQTAFFLLVPSILPMCSSGRRALVCAECLGLLCRGSGTTRR